MIERIVFVDFESHKLAFVRDYSLGTVYTCQADVLYQATKLYAIHPLDKDFLTIILVLCVLNEVDSADSPLFVSPIL